MTKVLATNWPLIAFVVVMVAMHRRGYGCGMHSLRQHQSHERDTEQAPRVGAGRNTP